MADPRIYDPSGRNGEQPSTRIIRYLERQILSFERIVERDADGAELASKRHLDAAWEYVRTTFDADDSRPEAERETS